MASSSANLSAVAASIVVPTGFATGLYAHLNGMRFLPWFGLGLLLPGIAFIPLNQQIARKKKELADAELEQSLEREPIRVESKTINLTPSLNESEGEQLKGADLSSLKPLSLLKSKRIHFAPTELLQNAAKKQAYASNDEIMRLNRLKTYLKGTWVFEDVLLDITKKAYFEGDKFGIHSNRRSITVPPSLVRYTIEKNAVKIRSQKEEWYVKPVSADHIEINGQVYTRIRSYYSSEEN